jgi:hypothetical protein
VALTVSARHVGAGRSRALGAAALAVLLTVTAGAAARGQSTYEQEPISYFTAPSRDPVARLQEKLARREATLAPGPAGYLAAVLKELDVPASSQTLVFSKTSFQRDRISPATPRALYFNDDTYVGWVPGGDVLELASTDAQLGTVFYTLAQPKGHSAGDGAAASSGPRPPKFIRQTHNCLQCHGSSMTRDVPGLLLRSVYPDRTGQPVLSAGTFLVNQDSPLAQRWGGWYVTGTHGSQRHMGNCCAADEDSSPEAAFKAGVGANVTILAGRFDSGPYLSGHSDIVALMVMEHQAGMHNLLTRANYQTRIALRDEGAMNAALGRPGGGHSDSTAARVASACEPVLKYMLFAHEAALSDPVKGTSDFRTVFESRGPVDHAGRSLRQFDLNRRLFKYPLSYLIYSAQFDGLPAEAKDYLYRRLWQILNGQDETGDFSHVKRSARRAIIEILRETKKDLPGYWISDAGSTG